MLLLIAIFLLTAVVVVPVFRRLQLGSVLGYIAAGVLIGPWGLDLIPESLDTLHVAELGVVLLLFLVGLELEPSRLWALRRSVFGLGAAQVIVCALVIGAAAHAFGIDDQAAIVRAYHPLHPNVTGSAIHFDLGNFRNDRLTSVCIRNAPASQNISSSDRFR